MSEDDLCSFEVLIRGYLLDSPCRTEAMSDTLDVAALTDDSNLPGRSSPEHRRDSRLPIGHDRTSSAPPHTDE